MPSAGATRTISVAPSGSRLLLRCLDGGDAPLAPRPPSRPPRPTSSIAPRRRRRRPKNQVREIERVAGGGARAGVVVDAPAIDVRALGERGGRARERGVGIGRE